MTNRIHQILNSDRLPSLPEVALRVVELAKADEPDFAALVTVIRADPAISARILKTANSALFGLRSNVSSIEAALPHLGITLTRTLVLGFSLGQYRAEGSARIREYSRRIWRSSLLQASAAEMLAHRNPTIDAPTWFLAGLLQDIGRLAMLNTFGNEYLDAIADATDDYARTAYEQSAFGFTHVGVSTELCRRWNLESAIVDAIASHHLPPMDFGQEFATHGSCDRNAATTEQRHHTTNTGTAQQQLATALYAGTICSDYLTAVVKSPQASRAWLDRVLMRHFAFCPDEIVSALADLDHRVGETSASLNIDVGECEPLEDILDSAQIVLSRLAMQSQLEVVTARRDVEQTRTKLQQVQEESAELRETAWRDALTGAYNRSFLSHAIEYELTRAADTGMSLGFLFLDIDKFKHLNDTYGHVFGDRSLCRVVDVIRTCIRPSDTVVRYGGDEFIVLLVDVTEEILNRIAERICERISDSRLPIEGESVRLATSVGALMYTPADCAPMHTEAILQRSDTAMYQAKQRGGNQVAFIRL